MSPLQRGVVLALAVLVTSAAVNTVLAVKAENDNPPIGKFVVVDGVQLHYVEMGAGEPVVFLHGNGSMIQDFASSGILHLAARSHRVVAFDRPGFGHSQRPNDRDWTPAAQARLFRMAFARLAIEKPIVVAHSWGTLVAMRLAVDFRDQISRLVLLSGYYFPTLRLDTWTSTPGALPLIGPVIQRTIGPLVARLAAGAAIKLVFDPLPVSQRFAAMYSTALAVRPSQLEAYAAEAAMMPAAVGTIAAHYRDIDVPVRIFAGANDQIVDTDVQSTRLHHLISESTLHVEEQVGHMIHHAIPERIMHALAN